MKPKVTHKQIMLLPYPHNPSPKDSFTNSYFPNLCVRVRKRERREREMKRKMEKKREREGGRENLSASKSPLGSSK